tara:strand:+ start:21397 stop:21702 length:306 start_codon:yes stop_codon:yes gene_type:complete
MPTNNMRPIHPGEILQDELDMLDNMSSNRFAKHLAVPTNRITHILNGTRSITADTALRLATFFGTQPEFWLNLQNAFDIKMTRKIAGKRIEKEVTQLHRAA